MSDEPLIELPQGAQLCRVHNEFFRHEYPRGVPIFMVYAFQAAVESEEIQQAAGADAHKLNAVIAEFGPLCRIVGPDKLLEIFRSVAETDGYDTPWFSEGRCAACRKRRPETRPYSVLASGPAGGTMTVQTRVCVECVAAAPCQTEGS